MQDFVAVMAGGVDQGIVYHRFYGPDALAHAGNCYGDLCKQYTSVEVAEWNWLEGDTYSVTILFRKG